MVIEHQKLAIEIVAMAKKDQDMRNAWIDGRTEYDPSIDTENTIKLKKIIAQLGGWPTISLVGAEASHYAWLLAQHADEDPDFQESCLKMMQENAGDVQAIDVAYLSDRIAIKKGTQQLFGTQYKPDEKGGYVPFPLDDYAAVNIRRKELGLTTIEEQTKIIKERYDKK